MDPLRPRVKLTHPWWVFNLTPVKLWFLFLTCLAFWVVEAWRH